jgi:hypothetical protein
MDGRRPRVPCPHRARGQRPGAVDAGVDQSVDAGVGADGVLRIVDTDGTEDHIFIQWADDTHAQIFVSAGDVITPTGDRCRLLVPAQMRCDVPTGALIDLGAGQDTLEYRGDRTTGCEVVRRG